MASTPKSFGEVVGQVTDFARALSPKQRVLMIGGALGVAVLLFVFVRVINKPDMKPLVSGLKPSDAQAIGARLAARHIAFEVSPDGASIQVPSDKLDESRLEVASQPNTGGRLGFELFDKMNWVASDFDEKVNYQRAMEGELERTIQSMSGVDAVRVHLVLPPDSVFTERDRQAKASVVLRLRGRSFSRELHGAIARLVASAVDKLDPQAVTVVNADTGQMFAFNSDSAGGNSGESLEETLQARLLHTLEPVVGSEHVKATVRVEYDPTSNEETQESYDPNASAVLSTHKTEEQSGSGIAGVAGASSNVAGAQPLRPVAPPASGPQSRSENNTYAVSRRVLHSVRPGGALKRIAAAIVIDDETFTREDNGKTLTDRRKRSPEQLQAIEQLAKATIGIDAARGDVLTVANVSFVAIPVEQPVAVPMLERSRQVVNQWSWLIRLFTIATLFLVVYALFIRPIKNQIVAAIRMPARMPGAKPRAEVKASEESEPILVGNDERDEAKRLNALTRQLAQKVTAEPALSTRLVQNWLEEAEP